MSGMQPSSFSTRDGDRMKLQRSVGFDLKRTGVHQCQVAGDKRKVQGGGSCVVV